MKKVKITADIILQILQGVFNSDDINSVVVDTSAPTQWQGKTINECLNVDYYTFKHKPISTQQVIAKLEQEKLQSNRLLAVDRSYCLLSLSEVQRLYSKDVDMTTVEVNLEYFIQSHKIKLLEWLIEACNIELSGLRVPVELDGAIRQAVIIFDNPKVSDIMQNSSIGEAAIVDILCTMLLYPDAVSYSDYEVSFDFMDTSGEYKTDVKVPLSSFSFVNSMTQDAVPYASELSKVGSINLSCGNSFVLVFDGYNNDFVNFVVDKSIDKTVNDNNQLIKLNIKRNDKIYSHDCIIKDHQVFVNADTTNETHRLTLVTRGL